jgi:hypothetical protein
MLNLKKIVGILKKMIKNFIYVIKFIVTFLVKLVVLFFALLLSCRFLINNIRDLLHRYVRQNFYISFKRAVYWKKEFVSLGRKNWFSKPFNIKHAKRRFIVGMPLSFSQIFIFVLSFLNPFFLYFLVACETIKSLFNVLYNYCVYLKFKNRIIQYNLLRKRFKFSFLFFFVGKLLFFFLFFLLLYNLFNFFLFFLFLHFNLSLVYIIIIKLGLSLIIISFFVELCMFEDYLFQLFRFGAFFVELQ